MSSRQSRRSFMKKSAVGAAAVMATRLYTPGILHAENKGDKVRVAMIGCGGQGSGTHATACAREKLVAMVDPDPAKFAKGLTNAAKVDDSFDPEKVRKFDDYRKFFDAMHKEVDAVSVATPNHHHALTAMIAMKLGIAAYVEKPLCYDLHEARTLAKLAAETKVATQMGNQGHSGEGYRRLCEFIWAGAIGNVTEVYCWSDRANGGVGPRPPTIAPPEGMAWDNWIGPATYRDYHKDLHPHEWHGWHDFGNGSLGNMGCHVMDGAHWALKLGDPTAIECEDVLGGSDERYPVRTRIRWEFAAREGMSPVKVWWYDGRNTLPKEGVVAGSPEDDTVDKKSQNLPPIAVELGKKYNRKFESNGSLYVGDKGILFSGTYGAGISFVPDRKDYVMPEKTIPRIDKTLGHHGSFFNAVRGGIPASSRFEISSKLTELIILGCLSVKAGVGKKLEWDGPGMKVTNLPEVNRFLQRDYRKGWEA